VLGGVQGAVATGDETAAIDAEALANQERARIEESANLLRTLKAKIDLAEDIATLKAVGKEITPRLKAQMLVADVSQLREAYQQREREMDRLEGSQP